MPELSKTARASQVKEVKEKHVETTEEAIKAVRLELDAHIWPNCERISKLLAAYDTLKTAYVEQSQKFDIEIETNNDLDDENKRLKETNQNLEALIVHLQDDIHEMERHDGDDGQGCAQGDPLDTLPDGAFHEDPSFVVPEHQHEVDRMADEGCPHVGAIEN